MARPIWHGNISFGLVNIPVNLFSAVKTSEKVHFHLLDKKTNTRIHNQRMNEQGKPVEWENVVHAYEFQKGKYVIVDQKMLEKTAADNYETVAITEFIDCNAINPIFFEKPYYLLPVEKASKGYVLLHDILERTGKAAIAQVVIKTREHIAAIIPHQDILAMLILRYAEELIDAQAFAPMMPNKAKIKISAKEINLAEQLVKDMTTKWKPKDFKDENKKLLLKLINTDIKRKKTITSKSSKAKTTKQTSKQTSAEVLDFMELLKKSVDKKEKRNHAKSGTKHHAREKTKKISRKT